MNTTQPVGVAAAIARARPSRPSVWQVVRQFPRPVWLLFLGTFINKFGTFVVPFLALHLTRLGFSPTQAGICLGAYGLGHIVASLLGGQLADTIGRRNTIVFAMASAALWMTVLSQVQSLPAIMIVVFVTGVTGECYKPACSALLADLIPENDRVTAYAAYRFAINAGWAFGPAVAGWLAQDSYLWLFLGDGATSLVFGLVAWRYLPRSSRHSQNGLDFLRTAGRGVTQAVGVAARDPAFVRLLIATFAVGMVFLQILSTLGPEIQAAGHSSMVYGTVLGLNGVIVVLLELPASAFTRRLPPRLAISAGYALIGVGAALFAWADEPWEYRFGMAVMTVGEILSMPVALAFASRLAPEGMRGRYLGLFGLTWAIALACGPTVGLAVFAWNPTLLWLGCGVVAGCGALVAFGNPARNATEANSNASHAAHAAKPDLPEPPVGG